jgi:hypothetical protein
MPTIPENIPASLRSILEDHHFVEAENHAVRLIVDDPQNAERWYQAGKMYESFGLLCPAMKAYKQTLALVPQHKAKVRLASFEEQGVSSEDEEGIYQLFRLNTEGRANLRLETKALPTSIVRWGLLHDPGQVPLKKGESDFRVRVSDLSARKITLRFRSGILILSGLLGVVGLVLVAVLSVMYFLSDANSSRAVPALIGIAIVSASSVASFSYAGVSITIKSEGDVHRESLFGEDQRWRLAEGSYVLFAMNDEVPLSTKHCVVSLVSAEDMLLVELGTIAVSSHFAPFYANIAAAVAAITGVPLKIEGSMRHDNPRLTAALLQISGQMQPLEGRVM